MLLTLRQLSERTGRNISTLRYWALNRWIPIARRHGNRMMFAQDMVEFIAERMPSKKNV